jgi:hypothetical protein
VSTGQGRPATRISSANGKETRSTKPFAALLEFDMVGAEQRTEFERHTKETKRGNVCLAPGVSFQWMLPLDEAARLDDRGELEREILAAIEQGTKALKLRWPRSSG